MSAFDEWARQTNDAAAQKEARKVEQIEAFLAVVREPMRQLRDDFREIVPYLESLCPYESLQQHTFVFEALATGEPYQSTNWGIPGRVLPLGEVRVEKRAVLVAERAWKFGDLCWVDAEGFLWTESQLLADSDLYHLLPGYREHTQVQSRVSTHIRLDDNGARRLIAQRLGELLVDVVLNGEPVVEMGLTTAGGRRVRFSETRSRLRFFQSSGWAREIQVNDEPGQCEIGIEVWDERHLSVRDLVFKTVKATLDGRA